MFAPEETRVECSLLPIQAGRGRISMGLRRGADRLSTGIHRGFTIPAEPGGSGRGNQGRGEGYANHRDDGMLFHAIPGIGPRLFHVWLLPGWCFEDVFLMDVGQGYRLSVRDKCIQLHAKKKLLMGIQKYRKGIQERVFWYREAAARIAGGYAAGSSDMSPSASAARSNGASAHTNTGVSGAATR